MPGLLRQANGSATESSNVEPSAGSANDTRGCWSVAYLSFLSFPLSILDVVISLASIIDNKREQRSPEFGFFNDDYSDSEADIVDERRFKHHKHHHKPGGCNEYPCGGYPGFVSRSC